MLGPSDAGVLSFRRKGDECYNAHVKPICNDFRNQAKRVWRGSKLPCRELDGDRLEPLSESELQIYGVVFRLRCAGVAFLLGLRFLDTPLERLHQVNNLCTLWRFWRCNCDLLVFALLI